MHGVSETLAVWLIKAQCAVGHRLVSALVRGCVMAGRTAQSTCIYVAGHCVRTRANQVRPCTTMLST
jgi:hypothetical protein